jgi:hypothetical protein
VFIDETAVSTNMVRPNGWNPRGERLVGNVPMGGLGNADVYRGISSEPVSWRRW